MKWESGLNLSQYQAANQIDGQLLILAGAGSGKTKTLTHRICHMIENKIPAKNILAITFTNKAAKEMRERVAALLGTTDKPKVCTFHSLGFEIIKEFGHLAGYRNHIGICDSDDTKKRIKSALEMVEEIQGYKIGIYSKDTAVIKTLGDFISDAKDKCLTPDSKNLNPEYYTSSMGIDARDFSLAFSIYQNSLMEDNQVDFDDLISVSVSLLSIDDVAKTYWNRYKYISVDEYQDTSKAQFKMVYRLAEGNKNICVVGDDYQSIYAFRGADITNILSFESVFPDAKTIILGENYRSTPQIVNGASAVIAHNKNQKQKQLFSMNPDGKPITIGCFKNYEDEAAYVVAKIKKGLVKGKLPKDFAILYRNNALSRFIEDELLMAKIKYVIYGGVSFYARKEIKDIISYLRLAAGFEDRVSLKRIANTPKRGIGKKTLEEIEKGIKKQNGSLLTKLLEYSNESKKKNINTLALNLCKYRTYSEHYSLPELIQKIIEDTEYEEYLKNEYMAEAEEGYDRIENIRELVTKATNFSAEYKEEAPTADNQEILEAFLENISLLTDQDRNTDSDDCVKLMTMHTSKGLEFNTVFLVGCESNDHKDIETEDVDKIIEEERRLFYVAMTRAKCKLFITYSLTRLIYGQMKDRTPICFINEIPKEICKLVSNLNRQDYSKHQPQSKRTSNWYYGIS